MTRRDLLGIIPALAVGAALPKSKAPVPDHTLLFQDELGMIWKIKADCFEQTDAGKGFVMIMNPTTPKRANISWTRE